MLNSNGVVIRCVLPGKFKREYQLKKDKQYVLDVAATGDYVDIENLDDGSGRINKINERRNYISRKAPRLKGAAHRGERLEQIIAANIDVMVVVLSIQEPLFNNKVLDRILVAAESSHVDPIILVNKIDLDKESVLKWKSLYENIGYQVFGTSAKFNIGLDGLKSIFENKTSLFWGPSGVGKSSVINTLFPELNLKVKPISESTSKGTHTTVTALMEKVGADTFIIDTPGIREIEPYGIMKEDLCHYFIEFADFINNCKFNTCTHHHEPGCAVIDAVQRGIISEERFESYLNLLDSIEEDLFFN